MVKEIRHSQMTVEVLSDTKLPHEVDYEGVAKSNIFKAKIS